MHVPAHSSDKRPASRDGCFELTAHGCVCREWTRDARSTSGRWKRGERLDWPRSDHLSSMDAIDRARWSEASCFGRSSGAVAAPGSGTSPCLVAAASTSMLRHCPLDTSSTTDRYRRLTRHCLGRRLASPRHRRLSPPLSLPAKLNVEASPLLPRRRGLQAMPRCHPADPGSATLYTQA